MAEQSIGMMEGAFFVPKGDLLQWVNSTLKLEVTKIEQLGTGAVYCHLIDAMFPGKVAMLRVNWKAKNQWEFLNNYKILQQAFAKCKIQKYVDIEKLSRSKYQDNLEFIQWLKRYFDLHNKNDLANYDPLTARKHAEPDFSFVEMRNPLARREKDSLTNLRKSRSPYDKVKSKINNRSLTVSKGTKQTDNYYLDKLVKIKDILHKEAKQENKLHKIQQILQEIEGEIAPSQEPVEMKELETVPSKKVIDAPKKLKPKK